LKRGLEDLVLQADANWGLIQQRPEIIMEERANDGQCVNKSSDDNRREIRQPKTKCSVALLPMPSALEAVLRNYIRNWTPNPKGILFATRNGLRPRSRDNVVKCGLKPVLRKLGIPTANTGLHAFRHGLATELAEASVPLTIL